MIFRIFIEANAKSGSYFNFRYPRRG